LPRYLAIIQEFETRLRIVLRRMVKWRMVSSSKAIHRQLHTVQMYKNDGYFLLFICFLPMNEKKIKNQLPSRDNVEQGKLKKLPHIVI